MDFNHSFLPYSSIVSPIPPAWWAPGTFKMTSDFVQEEIGQTHSLALTIPLLIVKWGVGFLSCLAATSKQRRAGSYKRALISVEPPNPHPSIPLPSPGGWAEGWSTTREKKTSTNIACMCPTSCVNPRISSVNQSFLFNKLWMLCCALTRNNKRSKDAKTCLNIDIPAKHDSR